MAAAIPLVFGAAGAWLAPAGFAALGYTIGATIGSMLFAPKQQDQHFYGARLQDLRATQVEYGSPIHVRLGQTRGAGTVVWQSDFREVATTTTQESGGKGGGGGATSSQTTYTYFVDLMLLVNDIPSSGLLRVWKNNELVYNLSPTATDADIVATTSTEHWAAIRFYGGAADQLPDPDYEAAKGVGNVPAHRGSTTIFIKNLALGGGDMLPSLEFEIFTTGGAYIIRILDADTLASPDIDNSDLLSDALGDAFAGTWPVTVTQWTATGSRPYSFNTTTHIYPMSVDDAGNLIAAGATSYGNPITNPPANASLADSSLVTLATPDSLTYPTALAFDWRSGELGAVSANITAFKARQTAEWNGLLTSQAAALATIDAIPDLVSSSQVGGNYANLFEAEDAMDALIAANPVEDTTLGEVISGTAALAIAEVITNAGETGCSIEWTGTFTGKKRIVKRVTKGYAVETNGTESLGYTQLWSQYDPGWGNNGTYPQVTLAVQPKIYRLAGEGQYSAAQTARCTAYLSANAASVVRPVVTKTGGGDPLSYESYQMNFGGTGACGITYRNGAAVTYMLVYPNHPATCQFGTESATLYKVTETVTTTIVIEDLPAATASFTASAEQAALVGGFAVDYTAPIGGYDFSVGQPYTITTNLFNGAVPTSIESLSLQSAVAQLCNFGGLDAGDIDVSALSDETVSVPQIVGNSPFISGGGDDGRFGSSVALSGDGKVMAVGEPYGGGNDTGRVYIYDWIDGQIDPFGTSWFLRGVITPNDIAANDWFGTSVALSSDGTVLAVGAWGWEGSATDQGGVYIFDSSGSAWVQRGAVLTASDAAANDNFGSSVALSDNGLILAVGAVSWEGSTTNQGGVYIFDSSGSAWVQRGAVLTASDAAANDNFGSSVALSADGAVLAVGAWSWEDSATDQGCVYIFDRDDTSWDQRGSVLTAGDVAVGDYFGTSIALSSDAAVLVVSSYFWEGSATDQGGVYIFDRSGLSWVQRGAVLTAGDAAVNDYFGRGVALSSDGGTLVVGASAWEGLVANIGAVYTYNNPPVVLVNGLTITTASSMRQPIEALMGSYYFTACQSGNKIKFTPRGGSSLATFDYEDLGASFGDSTESALSFNMASDTELPSRMSVTYQVLEGDYQKDTQMSDRIVTAETNTVSDVMLPIIMSAAQAKGVAITNALDAQTSLMSAKIKVLFDHPELEPGDVVTVTDRDGSQYRMRITQIMDSFPIRELDLVLDDASILTYSGITTADFYSQTVVIPLVDSDGLYLDIPILSDINNDAGFYVVSGPVAEGKWYGAVTLQSDNDLDYVSGVVVPERGYFGSCTTTLGDWTGYHVFDEQNSITISIQTDAVLTSSTRAALLANSQTNAFLIGNEIIQAVNCTEISAGVWKLTRLLRGLRGTEWAMVDHGAGERAVWLRADGMRRLPMSNSLLGLSRYYKTFSVGRNAADYDGEAFTNMAIGMKPFSPTTARGARDLSGNLTITWQRRTRLSCRYGGAMGVSIPLGENVEQYEIDIYDDNTYTTVLRTITATSESAEYTAAQQVTDFGSAQAQVYVKIYQISQAVVRGYALTGAV